MKLLDGTKIWWELNASDLYNWRNTQCRLPYYRDLPSGVAAAIAEAHDRHHRDGTSCQDELAQLLADWPEYLR